MGDIDHWNVIRPLDWSLEDLPSLEGKVAIVTGANALTGIGGHTAHQLALKGATVYIGGRTLEKVTAGIRSMLEETPSLDSANLKPLPFDVGDLHAVKAAAEKILKDESRLDILINNAGIFPKAFSYDRYGVNDVMGTNHLGHFILTMTLLPLLEKTAKADSRNDVRIINVSSSAIFAVPPDASFATLSAWNNEFGGESNPHRFAQRYGLSKTANILFSSELQKLLHKRGSNIIVTAPHPGAVATKGAGIVLGFDSEEFKKGITPYQGALTSLWCAAHPEVRKRKDEFSGRYLYPYGGLKDPTALGASETEAKALWEVSEEVLKDVFG